jgi:hypothetical protein
LTISSKKPSDFFTEGRQGNEATGVGMHRVSKQTLLLPLMAKYQWRSASFCENALGETVARPAATSAQPRRSRPVFRASAFPQSNIRVHPRSSAVKKIS